MEKKTAEKFVTLSFLLFAAVVYITTEVIMSSLAGMFAFVQKLNSNELFNHGLPIGLAAIVFFFLQFNSKIVSWGEDVVLEISKVVWPSRKDTVAMTIVVCIMVFIASGILFLFDIVARKGVSLLVH